MGAKTDQVERSIREMVDKLEPGGKLNSERELAERFGAGRTTIRLILTKLTAEGIIRSEHGRGYFAVAPKEPAVQ